MRLHTPHLYRPDAHLRALFVAVCAWLLGACGVYEHTQDVTINAAPYAMHAEAHAAAVDADMREALASELWGILTDGTLQGRGLWQRGEVRRKGHAEPVELPDDAKRGIVDGYQYQAYLTLPPPRIARADDSCEQAEEWPACGPIDAHTHVAIERVGGIAGLTWRSDMLIAYRQSGHISLCACPPSALTERLPLCCSSLCCH